MRDRKKSFRHHSLQDEKSLQDILKAVSSGIARGKITFSDEDEKIVMRPEGLLELKVTALQEKMTKTQIVTTIADNTGLTVS